MNSHQAIQVIDLFAGPGGLGEGFSRCVDEDEQRVFRLALSVEKEQYAHQTLRLRAFLRQFPADDIPEEYYQILRAEYEAGELDDSQWKGEWERANEEALHAELGKEEDEGRILSAVDRATGSESTPTVLLGGPPCQAYSLAGRARLKSVQDYIAEEDNRHVLYREYLKIIARTRPAVFVMENVKGILSSRLNGERIFRRILRDLHDPVKALRTSNNGNAHRYRVHPIVEHQTPLDLFASDPLAYVVRCEEFGVPQRRHRVILVGVREDLKTDPEPLQKSENSISVSETIGGMPKIRSELSARSSHTTWRRVFNGSLPPELLSKVADAGGEPVAREMRESARALSRIDRDSGGEFVPSERGLDVQGDLGRWLLDPQIEGFCNHKSRSHMAEDLLRYLFASCFAKHHAVSPKLGDFPETLLPDHENAEKAARSNSLFADRFRVQLEDRPATTITSHISKDGHYYIHYDPLQCRSLTAREAARLQTFPDNYFFCGPRTAQYIQVGNAVPPYLAYQIAELVHELLADAGAI